MERWLRIRFERLERLVPHSVKVDLSESKANEAYFSSLQNFLFDPGTFTSRMSDGALPVREEA